MTRLVAPALIITIVAGLGAGVLQRRLRPSAAARVLTALAIVATSAVVWALLLLIVGFLVQIPWIAEQAGWCQRLLAAHDQTPAPLGLAAMGVLVAMAIGAIRFDRRQRAQLRRLQGCPGLHVVGTDEAIAYAIPGRPGTVVVSKGMLDVLNHDERRALFAHEQSHLDRFHHRHLRLVGLSAAALPFLRPLFNQLRFATERWADEDAVAAVGDRRIVASAIARAALAASAEPAGALAMTGTGVVDRVEALLADDRHRPMLADMAGVGGVAAAMAGATGSTVQLHHLVLFSAHVCGLG